MKLNKLIRLIKRRLNESTGCMFSEDPVKPVLVCRHGLEVDAWTIVETASPSLFTLLADKHNKL